MLMKYDDSNQLTDPFLVDNPPLLSFNGSSLKLRRFAEGKDKAGIQVLTVNGSTLTTPVSAILDAPSLTGARWLQHVQQDLNPWWTQPSAFADPAYPVIGNFPTARNNDGSNIDLDKLSPEYQNAYFWQKPGTWQNYTVAQARQTYAYGVAYHLTGDLQYLNLAKAGVDWMRANLIDRIKGGAYQYLNRFSLAPDNNFNQRTSQEQAYALMGLTFYYYLTQDNTILPDITSLKNHIFNTYYDPVKNIVTTNPLSAISGGAVTTYNLTSNLDQINAYLLLLTRSSPSSEQTESKTTLVNLANILINQFYSPTYNIFWNQIKTGSVQTLKINAADYGHAAKTFWYIYTIGKMTGNQYLTTFAENNGKRLLAESYQVDSGTWAKAPYLDKNNNFQQSLDKSWWIYAEQDQFAGTMSLDDPTLIDKYVKNTANWYFENMVDKQYGGVYDTLLWPSLKPDNSPKQHLWKNGFHEYEHALVGYLTTQGALKQNATLYFARQPGQERKQLFPYFYNGSIANISSGSIDPSSQLSFLTTSDLNKVAVTFTNINNETGLKVNGPPTVSNVSKNGDEDTVTSFTPADFISAFSDVDGDTLTRIQIISLPTGGILKLNNVAVVINQEINLGDIPSLCFQPDLNFNGTNSFNWNGFDGSAYDFQPAQVTITINPVNDPPSLQNPLSDRTIGEGQTLNFTIAPTTFFDPDSGDSQTYSLAEGTILPGGLNFDPVTGNFSGTLAGAAAGIYPITLIATDKAGAAVGDTFSLTVLNFIGTPGKDTLVGTPDGEKLQGLEDNDSLTGSGGDDTLEGGTGNDTLTGGAGDDTYIVDSGGDRIRENLDQGTDLILASVNWSLSSNVENLVLTGSGNLSAGGNSLDNSITGNDNNNNLSGSAGDDSLTGGGGNDNLNGGVGQDTLSGGVGDDTYNVDSPDDVVVENPLEGKDSVKASVGYTLPDNVDRLTLSGFSNIDGIGNGLDNAINGNNGNNTLTAGVGNDTLKGGAGNDLLDGGDGDDFLAGGAGADTLTGAGGFNIFIINPLKDSLLTSFDTITDLKIGSDRIDGLSRVVATSLRELGAVSELGETEIGAVLTWADFPRNGAATFTFGMDVNTRTFLALNDSRAGFNFDTDAIVEITGYTGNLNDLAIV